MPKAWLNIANMTISQVVKIIKQLPKDSILGANVIVDGPILRECEIGINNGIVNVAGALAYVAALPCSVCGVQPRVKNRSLCRSCNWKKYSDQINPKRRNDKHRQQQKEYHNNNTKVAEKLLMDKYGKEGKYICQKCGFASQCRGSFSLHHVDPKIKTGTFNYFSRCGKFEEKLLTESVELICENCHRLHRIAKRPKNRIKNRLIEQLGIGFACQDCKKTFEGKQLDFHHRFGTKKLFGMSTITKISGEALEEAKKCDLLCACCHQYRHFIGSDN